MTKSLVALAVATTVMMVIAPCIGSFGLALGGSAPGRVDRIDDPRALLVIVLANVLGPLVGGFLAAKLAGRRELLHALVFGLIMFAGAAIDTWMRWAMGPVWFHVLFLSVLIPSGLAGGFVARALRSAEPPPKAAKRGAA